ncbi:MAG: CBS domain-containing protein [Saprospiraceae bacterium]|nr:CBS domain-containing protein [Pyrinomonadaceae bacterium]
MNESCAVCTESTPLEQVFESMQRSGDPFAVVVENNAHRKPIGIITEYDICFQIVGRSRNPKGMAAANVMNTRIVKAGRDQSVSDCVKLAEKSDTARILVVDENGILCGTISRDDLARSRRLTADNGLSHRPYADLQVSRMDRIF